MSTITTVNPIAQSVRGSSEQLREMFLTVLKLRRSKPRLDESLILRADDATGVLCDYGDALTQWADDLRKAVSALDAYAPDFGIRIEGGHYNGPRLASALRREDKIILKYKG